MVQSIDEVRRRNRASSSGGRVPPHNLEAEESLLGAMLLSKDAIAAALEICAPDDFYKPAHSNIFEAIQSLYGQGEPADPVTVADELRRAGLLDAMGGPSVLITLQANTPAIANAARYARIVEEHALLRRLIGVAGEIAELSFGVPDDIAAVVDRAESMVFEVADRKATDTLKPLRELLSDGLDRLEHLYDRNESITGVPTGYADLDERLSGLQPSNLVIVGARPSAGKTSFALGIASHAAMEARKPVLFFSLEMSHQEITQRLLCSEARVDAGRLRNGRLHESDWPKISHAIGRLGEAPIFVDDNPNLTVMDVRGRARRMKSRIGELGVVIIDYLQLMSGRNSAENRQVEVSEISRGLKILARELETPVVALSQLSRNLEMRSDKRPILADLRESGCLTADTRVLRADTNAEVTLGELLAEGARDVPVWSLDDQWRLVPATMTHVFPSGVKPVHRLKLASGRIVDATANHPFLTLDGWVPLGDLREGSRIAVPRTVPGPERQTPVADDEVILLAHLLGDGCVLPRQPVHYTSADPANLAAVEVAARRFGVIGRRVRQERWWHVYLPAPTHLTHGRHNPIHAWWAELGLRGCRSYEKFVPRLVFGLPIRQVQLFLRHLWATDGSLTISDLRGRPHVRLYYATTSRRLADDVQLLLLRLGIQSRVRIARKAGYRDSYHVTIDGSANQLPFLEEVGVHGARGEKVARAVTVLRSVIENPNVDTVPTEARTRIVAAMAKARVSQRQLAAALGEDYCGSYLLGNARRPRSFSRRRLAAIADVLQDKELDALAHSDVLWDRVVSIEPLGDAPVFDATVLGTHNFVANGIVAHNSLEQDADVVMFIYRDEVYNPESADRGTAEIIVSKHRNGPTGTTRLAFLENYTRFANMARI